MTAKRPPAKKAPRRALRRQPRGQLPVYEGKTARHAREYLAQHSQAVENLCRMALGKPRRAYGPQGKARWVETTDAQQAAAIKDVIDRLVPTLKSQELTGSETEPIAVKNVTESGDVKEIARRTAYILSAATGVGEWSPNGSGEAPSLASPESPFSGQFLNGHVSEAPLPVPGPGETESGDSPEETEPGTVILEREGLQVRRGDDRWEVVLDGKVIRRYLHRAAAETWFRESEA